MKIQLYKFCNKIDLNMRNKKSFNVFWNNVIEISVKNNIVVSFYTPG